MNIVDEFKTFALKGNAFELAVGVVIGAAFGNIVNSLVKDIISPPLGLLTGNSGLAEKVITLRPATETAQAITLNYGQFITNIIDFLIIAIAIFIVVRYLNSLHKKEESNQAPAPAKPSREVELLTEIRDQLKK
jgi:large conductance mechanosensitive channel